jgi:hypothetical protein
VRLRQALSFACLSLLLLALACTGDPAASRAIDTVRLYRQALEHDDPRAAYALLAPHVQRDVPYPVFEDIWKTQKAERDRQLDGIKSGAAAPLIPESTVELGDGRNTRVVLEDEGWRLTDAELAGPAAKTPVEAGLRLADALEHRNVAALWQLMSSRRRELVGKQVDLLVAGLRSSDNRQVVITAGGERATITIKINKTIRKVMLVKDQAGHWRVDDLD